MKEVEMNKPDDIHQWAWDKAINICTDGLAFEIYEESLLACEVYMDLVNPIAIELMKVAKSY